MDNTKNTPNTTAPSRIELPGGYVLKDRDIAPGKMALWLPGCEDRINIGMFDKDAALHFAAAMNAKGSSDE